MPLILDATIIAHLISAWLQAPANQTLRSSAATLQLQPEEGMLGYTPIHPCGYSLAPTMLLSPTGANPEMLQALREPYILNGHFVCQTPIHQSETITSQHIFASLTKQGLYDAEKLSICEGVSQFFVDTGTSRFSLLPARMYQTDACVRVPTVPNWIEGDLLPLFSCLLAGFGSMQTIWPATPQLHRTFSLPHYLFYQPFERRQAS